MLIFIYRKGATQHRNNIQLGKFGRNRTNVWSYPSANMSRQGRAALKDHPTPKPVAMIADIMKDVTVTGDAGYEYQGRKFKSLSEIAKTITGTSWNGWRFFGIKDSLRAGVK